MKRFLCVASAIAFALLLVFTVACLFTPVANRCDFNFRMTEIDCVKQGVDPFKVWHGEVVLPPYYPNSVETKNIPEGCTRPISVYAPWEYTLLSPLSFLPKNVAWWIFAGLSVLSLPVLVGLLFKFFRGRTASGQDALLLTLVPCLLVSYPLWSNVMVGNHMAVVLAGTFGLMWALNRQKKIAAGICWALMMVKPQIGLIFALPILFRLEILVGLVAAFLCVILSVPAAVACHTPLLKMLHEPSIANAFAFEGCGTAPLFLCECLQRSDVILVGMAIGVAVCAAMTWFVRKERDWLVYLMPAAITSCCWTYTQTYSHAMGWFLCLVLLLKLLENPKSRSLWMMSALAVILLPRWLLASQRCTAFFQIPFPMSETAFRFLDNMNSTATLFLAVSLCVWIWRDTRNKQVRAFADANL